MQYDQYNQIINDYEKMFFRIFDTVIDVAKRVGTRFNNT